MADIDELIKYESVELRNETDRSEIKKMITDSIAKLEAELVEIQRMIQVEALYQIDYYNFAVDQLFDKNDKPFLNCNVRHNQNSVSIYWQKARVFNNPKTGKKQVIFNYIKMRNKDGYSPLDFKSEAPDVQEIACSVEDDFKLLRRGLRQITEIKKEISKLSTIVKNENFGK